MVNWDMPVSEFIRKVLECKARSESGSVLVGGENKECDECPGNHEFGDELGIRDLTFCAAVCILSDPEANGKTLGEIIELCRERLNP